MAKYYGVAGVRKGNVGTEKYYLRNKSNLIQEAKKYIPVNSYWITKEEFKNYILSLIEIGIPDLTYVKEVCDNLTTKSLQNVYNAVLPADKFLCTDANGIVTTVDAPSSSHLYMHCYHYFNDTMTGFLNFVIYTTKATRMNLTDIYNFLTSINCNNVSRTYPASGSESATSVVIGIFASIYQDEFFVEREFSFRYFKGGNVYTERWNFFDKFTQNIVQIF